MKPNPTRLRRMALGLLAMTLVIFQFSPPVLATADSNNSFASASVKDIPATSDVDGSLNYSNDVQDYLRLTFTAPGSVGICLVNLGSQDEEISGKIFNSDQSLNFASIGTLTNGSTGCTPGRLHGDVGDFYYVRPRVITQSSTHNFSYRLDFDFHGAGPAPASPTLDPPSLVECDRVRLDWNDVEGESRYEIWRSGASGSWDWIATEPAGRTYHNDRSVLQLRTYSYYLRACSDTACSAPSNTRVVETPGCVPEPAEHPSPEDGAVDVPLETILSWRDGGGADLYDVFFGTDPTPDLSELVAANIDDETYGPGPLEPGTTYHWRVDAQNQFGETEGDVWSFTTEAPPTLIDQAWVTAVGDDEYTIRVLSWAAIDPYAPLTDPDNIHSIYIVDSAGEIVSGLLAVELLFEAQSVKRFLTLDATTDFRPGLDYGDVEEGYRDTPDPYSAHRPFAPADWWSELFIFRGSPPVAAPGLDFGEARIDVYRSVILDAVLQPDLDPVIERQSAELLETLRAHLEDTPEMLVMLYDTSNEILNMNNLQAFQRAVEAGVIPDPILIRHLRKLGDVLDCLEDDAVIVEFVADAARYLYRQTLANAAAERRLRAIELWVADRADLDPAVWFAVQQAGADFEEMMTDGFYLGHLTGAILEAAGENVVDLIELTKKYVPRLRASALAQVAVPYLLSYEAWELIREQTTAAQEATMAATLVAALDRFEGGQDEFLRMVSVLDGPSYQREDALRALNLLGVRYYLGYHFYRRYLDFINNSINVVVGYLRGGFSYHQLVTDLEERMNGNLMRLSETAPPFFLARGYPLDGSGSTEEQMFLLSRLRFELPPIEPGLDVRVTADGPLDGEAPVTIDFVASGAPESAIWSWSFDNGDTFDGRDPGPQEFPEPRLYRVTVTVESGTQVASATVFVTPYPAPLEPVISVTTPQGPAPLSVSFSSDSVDEDGEQLWAFGDGGFAFGSEVSHVYEHPGSYTVSLTALEGNAGSSTTIVDQVQVSGPAGGLEVQLNVDAVVVATGPRQFVGHGSVVDLPDLPAGTYTVEFGDVVGHETPEDAPATVSDSGQTVVEETYPPTQGPILSVTPDSLEFGQLSPGETADLPIAISNVGSETLSGSVSVDAPFDLGSTSAFSLASGESAETHVLFEPVGPGIYQSSATVTSNGGTEVVSLSGEMVDGAVCYESLAAMPATCTGQITNDSYGGCRTIACADGGSTLEILACPKPDGGPESYFEMYRQSASGSSVEICIAGQCLESAWGFVRSQDYPICFSEQPSLSLVEPDGVGDVAADSFEISWVDDDPDSNAQISLFYDGDAAGEDGVLIVGEIAENDPADSYTWDTSNLPAGTYWVYAVIDDGVNQPVVAYSPGPVTIIACYESLAAMPATCTGQITNDTYGGCRTIACEDGAGALQIMACPKPDQGSESYFEMYRQSASGGSVEICIAGQCLESAWGFVRSADYPICVP